MNELKQLRTFEADVPPLTPAARGEARHRLLRAIAANDGPDDRRVRAWRPSPRVRLVTAAALAVAVAVAAGAVASQVAGDHTATRLPVRPVSAAYVLERAAVTAAARPWQPAPRPTQWLYEKVAPPKDHMDRGEWIRYDGRQHAWYYREKLRFAAPGQLGPRSGVPIPDDVRQNIPDDVRQALTQSGTQLIYSVVTRGHQRRFVWAKRMGTATDSTVPPKQWRRYLGSLPTDPDQLLERIYRDARPGSRAGTRDKHEIAFQAIARLLTCGALIPPDINAALYRAAAKIPGVRAETGITDTAGRTGIAVSRHVPDWPGRFFPNSQQIIFNPDTYAYWGYRFVADRAFTFTESPKLQVYIPAGQVMGGSAIITSALVDRPGQLPN